MTLAQKFPWRYLATLLVTNLTTLFLPASAPLRVAGALLLIGLLPGLSWANWLLASSTPLLRWVIAAALSYTLTMLATLLLHYLPGPIQTWQLLVVLDILALIPILKYIKFGYAKDIFAQASLMPSALVMILLLALFLRSANLHYSEFQGDESLAMIAAAEALEGPGRHHRRQRGA